MDNAPSARDRQDAVVVVAMPRERFDNLVRALATLDERFNGTLTYRLARFLHSSDLFTAAFPLQQGIIYCHHAHGQFIRSALDKGKELSEKAVDLFEGLIKGEAVNGGAPMEVLKVLSDRAYSLRFMARAEKNNLPDPRIKEEPLPEACCSLAYFQDAVALAQGKLGNDEYVSDDSAEGEGDAMDEEEPDSSDSGLEFVEREPDSEDEQTANIEGQAQEA